MPVAELRRAAVQLGEQQLKRSTARAVFLHLRRGALRIVRGVYLELFAEPAFELKAVVELKDFLGIFDIAEPSEGRVLARPSMVGDAVVTETELVTLYRHIDGQEAPATIAGLQNHSPVGARSVLGRLDDHLAGPVLGDE